MRTVRYELLRPDEIVAERERFSVAYLPVAPLEWHGPALPLGTDPLAAEAIARSAAEITGGVVLPALYLGTDREQPPEVLESIGFEDPSQYIIGVDFPANSLTSLYVREDILAITVREFIRLLVKQQYKLIVIVNGHGAAGQEKTFDRLCAEFNGETESKVINVMDILQYNEVDDHSGHATRFETALQMYLNPESVDLQKLPVKPAEIRSTDFGIVDGDLFTCQGREDKIVIDDPRDATAEIGKIYYDTAVKNVCDQVMSAWQTLSNP